jgi:prevent-host-death family protein
VSMGGAKRRSTHTPHGARLHRGPAEMLLCSTMERIGVRELRQHASRYLARVAAGEAIEVTDRGRAVALLVPTHEDRWKDLVASGQVVPAAIEGNLVDEAPDDYGIDASAQLAAMRDDER